MLHTIHPLVLTSLQGKLLLSIFNRIENRCRENSSCCLIFLFSLVGKLLKRVSPFLISLIKFLPYYSVVLGSPSTS